MDIKLVDPNKFIFMGGWKITSMGMLIRPDGVYFDDYRIRNMRHNHPYQVIVLNSKITKEKREDPVVHFIHRIVATAFILNPYGFNTVRHKNGNTMDNRVENLEWSQSGPYKNPEQIKEEIENITKVCRLIIEGELSAAEIANMVGIPVSHVYSIKRGNVGKAYMPVVQKYMRKFPKKFPRN